MRRLIKDKLLIDHLKLLIDHLELVTKQRKEVKVQNLNN